MGWDLFVFHGVETPVGLAAATLGYSAVFLAIWLVLVYGAKQTGVAALKGTVLVHHLVVGPGALLGIALDPALTAAVRCFGCSEAAELLLRDPAGPSSALLALAPMTLGYMVLDLVLFSYWDISGTGDRQMAILMIGHHVLSLLSWPFALIFDFCARYVLILLAYEVSSIFLVIKWMLTVAGQRQGPAFMINGALFTSTFLLIRVLAAFPQLRALHTAPPWGASAEGYELFWWMPLLSTWVVLPHLLNFFWGYKVFLGSLALLRGKGQSTMKPESEELLQEEDPERAADSQDSKVEA